jgi:hypothetical protein
LGLAIEQVLFIELKTHEIAVLNNIVNDGAELYLEWKRYN